MSYSNSIENILLNKIQMKLLSFQIEGVDWMKKQEKLYGGGILADEMGMGKTIQMISLIASDTEGGPTLIIVPTISIMQWSSEIAEKVPCLSSFIYFKDKKTVNDIEAIMKYDIVMTTYRKFQSSSSKKDPSILHRIYWSRIILDEAQIISNTQNKTTWCIYGLASKYRWLVTGTPIQNKINDLRSFVRFLQLTPYSFYYCSKCPCKNLNWDFENSVCIYCNHASWFHYSWMNYHIITPIREFGESSHGKKAFDILRELLDKIMLRRFKTSEFGNIELPPRLVSIRKIHLNEKERAIYSVIDKYSKAQFMDNLEGKYSTYLNPARLLMAMRQILLHPDLLYKKRITQSSSNSANESLICNICHESSIDCIISKCKHLFCRKEIWQFVEQSKEPPKCPKCFSDLIIDLNQETYAVNSTNDFSEDSNPEDYSVKSFDILKHIDLKGWKSSSKLEALIEELNKLRNKDYSTKSIVFSSFVSFLDLAYWRLSQYGFGCCRLTGNMNPEQRRDMINAFSNNHELSVILVNLRSGGISINLVEANSVILCEPWWNPSIEDQAMDRIHRLGQWRPIHVIKLITVNSIEERILQLQHKKRILFNSVINAESKCLNSLNKNDLEFLLNVYPA